MMENKKGINLFFAMIAFVLGLTLFRHLDTETWQFKDPVMDILYLIVLYIHLVELKDFFLCLLFIIFVFLVILLYMKKYFLVLYL